MHSFTTVYFSIWLTESYMEIRVVANRPGIINRVYAMAARRGRERGGSGRAELMWRNASLVFIASRYCLSEGVRCCQSPAGVHGLRRHLSAANQLQGTEGKSCAHTTLHTIIYRPANSSSARSLRYFLIAYHLSYSSPHEMPSYGNLLLACVQQNTTSAISSTDHYILNVWWKKN